VGAVVITGDGPAFCAGADLSHLSSSADGGAETGLRSIYEGFLRIGRSPLPTIAAVNGAAVGAGMNLALACDVRLAATRARFDTRFLQLGLHPGGGHTWMFRRIAGPQAVAAAVLFGEVLDGPEAERVGLVWRCVPDDELLTVAHTMATRAAAAPHELAGRIKATIADMADVVDAEAAVDRELGPQVWSIEQPAFRERVAALQAKITSR
jgi:enoyl-CoA hydratase